MFTDYIYTCLCNVCVYAACAAQVRSFIGGGRGGGGGGEDAGKILRPICKVKATLLLLKCLQPF